MYCNSSKKIKKIKYFNFLKLAYGYVQNDCWYTYRTCKATREEKTFAVKFWIRFSPKCLGKQKGKRKTNNQELYFRLLLSSSTNRFLPSPNGNPNSNPNFNKMMKERGVIRGYLILSVIPGKAPLCFVLFYFIEFDPLTLFRTRGRLLRPAPTLKIYNFMTIKAITTKLGDFS